MRRKTMSRGPKDPYTKRDDKGMDILNKQE